MLFGAVFVAEIILSSFARDLPVVDGVDGAVVVAAEAAGAASVMLPAGRFLEGNLAHGTFLGAASAVDADIGVDGEFLVGNHIPVEIGTDDMAECPGRQTPLQAAVARLAVDDNLDEFVKVVPGLLRLLAFALRRVRVHERQADVAFGHDERLAALKADAFEGQFLRQHFHGQSCAVAAGAQRIGIMARCLVDGHPANELADDMGRLPPMYREAEADALLFRKRIFARRIQLVGYGQQPLVRGCCQLFGGPACIACTREIEDHSGIFLLIHSVMPPSRLTHLYPSALSMPQALAERRPPRQ